MEGGRERIVESLLLADPLLVDSLLWLLKAEKREGILEALWALFHQAGRSMDLQTFALCKAVSDARRCSFSFSQLLVTKDSPS